MKFGYSRGGPTSNPRSTEFLANALNLAQALATSLRRGTLCASTAARASEGSGLPDELPCLGLLEATPAILRGLMSEISEEDARWKPAGDRFSIAEVLSHLSHSEGHCYRARVDRFPERGDAGVRARRRADA